MALENKPGPSGVPMPSKDHNWSGMLISECVVSQWLLCSFTVTDALMAQTLLYKDPPPTN